jgi:hypothetical protein
MTAANPRQTQSYGLLFRKIGVISTLNKFMTQKPLFKCRKQSSKYTKKCLLIFTPLYHHRDQNTNGTQYARLSHHSYIFTNQEKGSKTE